MEPIINEPIIGVIYPLTEKIINYMFENKRDVFVKYLPHGKPKKPKLKEEMVIYFYQSGSNKGIVGEAIIKNIQYLNIDQIFKEYTGRLMTTEDELIKYSTGREKKVALVLELVDLKRYEKEIKLSSSLTMMGLYLTEKRKKKLFLEE